MPADTVARTRPGSAFLRWLRAKPKRKRYLRGVISGLACSLLVLVLYSGDMLDRGENWTLDQRVPKSASPGDRDLTLIQVDEEAMDYVRSLGYSWPPRRPFWGEVARYCREGGARAVVLDITFTEPSPFTYAQIDYGIEGPTDEELFGQYLLAAGGTYVACTTYAVQAKLPADLATPDLPYRIEIAADAPALPQFAGLRLPVPPIDRSAHRLGSAYVAPDFDGVVRRYPPLIQLPGGAYPSLSTALAADFLGVSEIRIARGRLELGDRVLPLDAEGNLILNVHAPWSHPTWTEPRNPDGRPYPFYGLRTVRESIVAEAINRDAAPGEQQPVPLPKEAFRDKVVFIGYSAGDLGDLKTMSIGPSQPGVLIHMTALDNMLHGDPIRMNDRRLVVAFGLLVGSCLAALAVSYFTSVIGFLLGLAMIAATWRAGLIWLRGDQVWVEVFYIATGQFLSLVVTGGLHYLYEYREKRRIRGWFSQYVAPEVVDEMLKDPDKLKLGGENREMTIFFSDLAGFTSISEGMSPEGLVSVMNEYLGGVTDVIRARRGTVDKYIGDAVMAFWNAPLDQPDHALRACEAAIDGQKFLEKLRARFPVLSMRVGLNTGVVTVGNMGTEEKKNYTVMGDAVNLASRLEGANKNYHTGTMIGEDTFRQVAGKFVTRELDLLRVKGKDQPVHVYELVGRLGEVDPKRMQVLIHYDKGLTDYRARRWSEAIQHFQSAADLDPEDGPTQVYLERCNEFVVNPPEPDWDGVTTLTTK